MSLLELLALPQVWEEFYEYKLSRSVPKEDSREIREFIDGGGFRLAAASVLAGEAFPLPRRSVISKMSTGKKRVVYTYPREQNLVLKLLTFLLLRQYDGLFSEGLWSFRPGRTAKGAVLHLLHLTRGRELWAYKADIHDYFNSIPVSRLLPELEAVTGGDPELFAFLRSLLTEERVISGGRIIREEQKGIMAGTPLSAFYANLYLRSLDEAFQAVPYGRYSDDIIVFAPTRQAALEQAASIRGKLSERGLELNPDKEALFSPEEGWTFLGFAVRGDTVDIAPATVKKLKAKMRRKARSLVRWAKRSGAEGQRAARAFVRIFNRKLLEGPGENELTWSRWFFPVITTSDTLHEIDLYCQDCLRYIASGTRKKSRFNVRYEDLKALGCRSLVNEYYRINADK